MPLNSNAVTAIALCDFLPVQVLLLSTLGYPAVAEHSLQASWCICRGSTYTCALLACRSASASCRYISKCRHIHACHDLHASTSGRARTLRTGRRKGSASRAARSAQVRKAYSLHVSDSDGLFGTTAVWAESGFKFPGKVSAIYRGRGGLAKGGDEGSQSFGSFC